MFRPSHGHSTGHHNHIVWHIMSSWHMLSQLISAALQGCGLTGAREGKIVPAGGEATASQTHQAISEGQEWRLGTGDFGRIMFPSSSHQFHINSISEMFDAFVVEFWKDTSHTGICHVSHPLLHLWLGHLVFFCWERVQITYASRFLRKIITDVSSMSPLCFFWMFSGASKLGASEMKTLEKAVEVLWRWLSAWE